MMASEETYTDIEGVPDFTELSLGAKRSDYALLIPVINEGTRIQRELKRAAMSGINSVVDIVICDGGSSDGSLKTEIISCLGVHTLLTKTGPGKQAAQLRMGIWWAMQQGYKGVITIDGNNKDSIEDVPVFVNKLKEGFDFIQGSRFIRGGRAVNTPLSRLLAVKLIHAPLISITARQRFTDTTNAYRGYSMRYLKHPSVQPLRDIFHSYELLAYLSVRASQLGLRCCEVPVTRAYPPTGQTPTKISPIKGNLGLIKILLKNLLGAYKPSN